MDVATWAEITSSGARSRKALATPFTSWLRRVQRGQDDAGRRVISPVTPAMMHAAFSCRCQDEREAEAAGGHDLAISPPRETEDAANAVDGEDSGDGVGDGRTLALL